MSQTVSPENFVSLDPWTMIANAYGLGAPPAPGMPATLPGVRVPTPPQMQFDPQQFLDFMNQIGGGIRGAYDYEIPTAQATLIDPSQLPALQAQTMDESAELRRLLSGEGYSPQTLALMRANAIEQPAQAGLQQMSQMRRALGEAGIQGGAEAAVRGEVARQTGQAQGQALRDVGIRNADVANENLRFGVGQQTAIGMSNMQAANQMALAQAQQMFDALRSNQMAQNEMAAMNTGLAAQRGLAGANAMSGYLGQQGMIGQQQRYDTNVQNNQNLWEQKKIQTGLDWDRQRLPWEELNRRFGQAQNILGGWASQ